MTDATTTAKEIFHDELRRQGVSNAELARRMGVSRQEVWRILSPDVNPKIGTLEAALAALGKRLVVGVEGDSDV